MTKLKEPSMPWVIDMLAKKLKKQYLRKNKTITVKSIDGFLTLKFKEPYWRKEFNLKRQDALDYLDMMEIGHKADKSLKRLVAKDYKERIRTRILELFKLVS